MLAPSIPQCSRRGEYTSSPRWRRRLRRMGEVGTSHGGYVGLGISHHVRICKTRRRFALRRWLLVIGMRDKRARDPVAVAVERTICRRSRSARCEAARGSNERSGSSVLIPACQGASFGGAGVLSAPAQVVRIAILAALDVLEGSGRDLHRTRTQAELNWGWPGELEEAEVKRIRAVRRTAPQ